MLSKSALEEFKIIWREEFGTEINDQEATDQAINLLTLFDAIYKPIKSEWVEEKDGECKKDSL
jgi:hypothetical protein